jgi:hypothetical protein
MPDLDCSAGPAPFVKPHQGQRQPVLMPDIEQLLNDLVYR